MGLGQAERGVEPVDRLHQVERGADDVEVGLGGDQAGVGHVGPGQRAEDPRLAAHRLVAVGPLVGWRPAQHVRVVAAAEPHEHVLRAAGDQLDVGDRTGARLPLVHPAGDPVEVDDGGVEDVRHRAIIPGPVWQPPTVTYEQLGFYTLAGAATSPRDLITEVADGERLGLGWVFISERFNVKEAATLSGAVGAVSTTLNIATAATNHHTRHPIVTASYATTMHRLTGGRFTLGLGRGIGPMTAALGLPPVTTAQLEDFAGLMRRLWHGETIIGHDGPAGKYPFLRLDSAFDEDIPLGITAFGPNTLQLAGRAYDQVVLHTFFDDETLVRCIRTVKESAEQAGRDPATVEVWSCLATIGDHLPEPVRLKKTVGRMATYLQAYGDLLVSTNGWDPAPLAAFRADPFVAGYRGAIDQTATTEELEHVATLIPTAWLATAAVGSPEQCVATIQGQFDLGADGVILHGASPGRSRADRERLGRRPPVTADAGLVDALRDGLAALGDPAKAPEMQRYMKSTMPYRGVPTPARRQLVRAALAAHAPTDRATWEATVRRLWDDAAFREERYVAIDLCAHRTARAWQDVDTVPLYDHMVVTGAWWDHVDSVAIPLLGPILRAAPGSMTPLVRQWSVDDDMWRRRTSIIVHNGSKAATDLDLLTDVIVANEDDRRFFVAKAIGWALREQAKTDPSWVRAFVAAHADRMAPLSVREALKHLG